MSRYLAVWDMLGLEYLCNITAIEKKKIFSILKNEKPEEYPNLNHIMMRASANPQRYYEIYLFDSEIEEQEIRDYFEFSPQVIVDSIRKVGQKLYSDRHTRAEAVIV